MLALEGLMPPRRIGSVSTGARLTMPLPDCLQHLAQVDPGDLPRLRVAIQVHLSAPSLAMHEAAQYALRW
jgi:hypothetical protein